MSSAFKMQGVIDLVHPPPVRNERVVKMKTVELPIAFNDKRIDSFEMSTIKAICECTNRSTPDQKESASH